MAATLAGQSLRFDNSFWTTDHYATGMNILYDKLEQGKVENEEIITFLRERISVEETYGKRLCDLSKSSSRKDGFLRDDGASLRRSFETVKSECGKLGESHLELAGSIYDLVLQPLLKYSEEHNKRLKSSNEEITGYLKLFDKMSAEVEKARVSYVTKCQIADELKEKADREAEERQKLEITSDKGKQQEKEQQASMKAAVVLGDQAFTELEIMKFLERMRDEIESQEVRIPFLGVYNDVYSGEDITRWLQENHPTADSWREAESIGQDLADQGFIKLVGAYGNRFTGSPSSYFQWKKKSFDLKETEDTVIKTKGWSFPTITSSSQPPDKRARREADEADEAYRHAIDHMSFLEKSELDRIKTSKVSFLNYAATFGSIISAIQSMSEKLLIYHEALKPEHDIQFMIERYRTGPFIPQVILYNNHYSGSANDQTFGVPLEEKAKHDLRFIPQIVTKCLRSASWSDNDKKLLWITSVPLASIHSLREELNDGGKITLKKLREYDLAIVAGILKLYFMELPECLLTFELYEPVKMLYSISPEDQDEQTKLSSVANLLNTSLPEGNYHTLEAFVSHLHRFIVSTQADDSYTTILAQIYGFILLRPPNESTVFLHDKHNQRLVKDLILHYETIFKNPNNNTSSSSLVDEVMKRSGSRESLASNRSSRSNRSSASSNHVRDSSLSNRSSNHVRDSVGGGSTISGKGIHSRESSITRITNTNNTAGDSSDTSNPRGSPVTIMSSINSMEKRGLKSASYNTSTDQSSQDSLNHSAIIRSNSGHFSIPNHAFISEDDTLEHTNPNLKIGTMSGHQSK
ncbi:8219_t:CDS:10 [Entrophospora sp. SA101]|nr:3511_t:CDS:10 [Entrophospora sp. SA101]CAJ0890873.1 8219_t:CDS:10 [Entrophospora sp. SA101]